ncbi:MAG TPA: transglycosylase SLT domain-containing protein [Xanthomonadaceae bacterium]|nr:transglycosylase SLT domain-containing protein [Xanthomonadaceae bacterium]
MTGRLAAGLLLLALAWPAARAAEAPAGATDAAATPTRSGRDIYQRFHEGLADPQCDGAATPRWRAHFAAAPRRLAGSDDDALALFGYVVDALRAASLPTEYALIPFVESGYRPGARSPSGPAGLWQMIKVTARNHDVTIRPGYDGRLSPVESTAAAVRYLKTLHGMFAGDWRLAVMAYNAGEYRVLGALRRSGQQARDVDLARLQGLPKITRDYVRKLHALSCLLDRADDHDAWLAALDHQVPVLEPAPLPAQARSLDGWARRHGRDAALVRRLNPAFAGGRIPAGVAGKASVLAPAAPVAVARVGADTRPIADADAPFMSSARFAALQRSAREPVALAAAAPAPPAAGRTLAMASSAAASAIARAHAAPDAEAARTTATHVVRQGESAWSIARRYGLRVDDLLSRNGLLARSVLRPGTVLKIGLDAGE